MYRSFLKGNEKCFLLKGFLLIRSILYPVSGFLRNAKSDNAFMSSWCSNVRYLIG